MVAAVRLDNANAPLPVFPNRAGEGERSVPSGEDRPILTAGATDSIYPESSSVHLSGRTDGESQPGEKHTPNPYIGRFRKSSEAFAAAHDIKRLAEIADEPRFVQTPFTPPFSGLVVRAVSLYDSSSVFLSGAPPRGTALNALS